jgi:hypothetical protein
MMDIGLRYCPFVAGHARRRRGIRPRDKPDTSSFICAAYEARPAGSTATARSIAASSIACSVAPSDFHSSRTHIGDALAILEQLDPPSVVGSAVPVQLRRIADHLGLLVRPHAALLDLRAHCTPTWLI